MNTIRFESGTTKEELIQYIDIFREYYHGKISESEIEDSVSQFLQNMDNMIVMCDGCEHEIPSDQEHIECQCKKCMLKYDLCEHCQRYDLVSQIKCPSGFGCNNDFKNIIPRQTQDPFKTYNAFGDNIITTTEEFKMNSKFFVEELKKCQTFPLGLIFIQDMNVSDRLLHDIWIHFRSVDTYSLEKYGPPKFPLPELPNYSIYQVFNQMTQAFQEFVSHDSGDINHLMLQMIYPNGDIFAITKVDPKQYVTPFLTMFFPTSQYIQPGEQTDYQIESFREMFEKKCGQTIEKMSETGKILLIKISIGTD